MEGSTWGEIEQILENLETQISFLDGEEYIHPANRGDPHPADGVRGN